MSTTDERGAALAAALCKLGPDIDLTRNEVWVKAAQDAGIGYATFEVRCAASNSGIPFGKGSS